MSYIITSHHNLILQVLKSSLFSISYYINTVNKMAFSGLLIHHYLFYVKISSWTIACISKFAWMAAGPAWFYISFLTFQKQFS